MYVGGACVRGADDGVERREEGKESAASNGLHSVNGVSNNCSIASIDDSYRSRGSTSAVSSATLDHEWNSDAIQEATTTATLIAYEQVSAQS